MFQKSLYSISNGKLNVFAYKAQLTQGITPTNHALPIKFVVLFIEHHEMSANLSKSIFCENFGLKPSLDHFASKIRLYKREHLLVHYCDKII